MNSGLVQMVFSGILLPESFLQSEFFVVLSAFVAINTIVYFGLAVAKILPKVYFADWIRGANRRAETRSIFPNAPILGMAQEHPGRHEDHARHRVGGDQAGSDQAGSDQTGSDQNQ